MRTWMVLLMLVTGTAALSGCLSISEIREQSFIVGMGIDRAENGELEISMMEIDMDGMKSGGNESSPGGKAPKYIIRNATGSNIPDCLRQIRTRLQKELSLDKVSFIMFSDKIAREGIYPYMDFLVRSPNIDQTVHMFVTTDKVSELFRKDNGGLTNFSTKGYAFVPTFLASRLWQVNKAVMSPLQSTHLNRFNYENKELNFVGESFLRKDRLVYHLNGIESREFNILVNRQGKEVILHADAEKRNALQIKEVKRKTEVRRDRVTFTYSIQATILESKEQNPYRHAGEIEKEGSRLWEKNFTKLLVGTKKQGLDILGIGEQFRMRGWDTAHWEEQIKKLDVRVLVHLKILSPEGKRE
ncbi:Ger(x)C family spore germination C-terminal domain-containing protein [Paenibacillus chitinolyticus]|uniref:Ger(x)C family spore germination protein n=1 Tax=Paenibacillus chitinolyticus TaxID=79263 RepID=UPI002DBF0187|nr:Ger(x)C family spore germination C-terminal domain-containing protein [Paenibacillus chitinolyticus]MEC0247527.1 Ger(x)C family spore germination C-terminal domain-containing protein [Paenibacillus chitinolyticus]